ncbi:CAP domain-containing protein [Actinomadura sp. 7K507]|nr:CAP domain-containing protein [Actinomadura sp. 7K507]
MRDPDRPAPEPSRPDEPPASKRPSGGGSTGGSGGSGGSGASTAGQSGPEAAAVSLTNAERAKAGCPALRVDQRLVIAARKHSADMAANDYFSHTSQNGESPWKRMEDAGYPSPGAENIAKGHQTAAAVVKGWMDSPGHRANILNCDLRAIGVGRASGPGGPLWTQNFGWK